ncbi:MAG TPA: membrane protein insertion efficiency factor YidD [Mucilaginibacter sp.]|nr:membrane protein insertion efficiency factor YidD [Mucilaginibacter sp.]
MGVLLRFIIRIYWLLPSGWRRGCVFKESCSRYVYRITTEQGFGAGMRALQKRYRCCRPGYSHYQTDDGREWVILKDQSVVERSFTNL